MTAPLQYSVWWEKRSLKFKFELWQPMKVKRANRLMSIIDMGDTFTKSRYFINDWYLEQIFSLYTCNYGFIYLQYWFKMLKRWKFTPLIKAHASSMNCTMGNLTCSRHATYLHTIYVKSPEIHILLLYKSLVSRAAPLTLKKKIG